MYVYRFIGLLWIYNNMFFVMYDPLADFQIPNDMDQIWIWGGYDE